MVFQCLVVFDGTSTIERVVPLQYGCLRSYHCLSVCWESINVFLLMFTLYNYVFTSKS